MVRWLLILLFCNGYLYTQAQVKVFSKVELDRSSVYVQQPFKVAITVYTATWYTAPLEFNNLQIPNAFIIPFSQTVPGMYNFDNQPYAGLSFYFIVFPYKAGRFELPSLSIKATTPPLGQSESRVVTLHTRSQPYLVREVPAALQGQPWMVAKGVSIQQHWNKSLAHLKVGDVIERKLVIDARGTLPQFIPDIPTEHPDFASVYPQDDELQDTRNDYDANGRKTQDIIYLLTKPGQFELPAVTITWWDPVRRRLYKRSAAATTINVAPNPDLGIVATLQDSLGAVQKTLQPSKPPPPKGPRLIAGMPWYQFLAGIIAATWILYLLWPRLKNTIRWGSEKWKAYLHSERYWFHRMLWSRRSGHSLVDAFYKWWDRFPWRVAGSSFTASLEAEKDTALLETWGGIEQGLVTGEPPPAELAGKFRKAVRQYRRNHRKQYAQLKESSLINERQLPLE